MHEFQLKFHWSLLLRVQLTIFQHWFRWWLGANQATSHYLNHWWLDWFYDIYASLGLNELTDHIIIFTRGQFWPSGIVVACVCVYVCVSVNHELVRAIIHQPFKLGSSNLDQRCKRPWLRALLFSGTIDLAFKVKLNFKVKIYPILSMWVCPCNKSPLIEVSISKFGPKMHLSTVKVPIDFGLDWLWSSVSFLISNLCFLPNFASLIHLRLFVYI